MSAGKTSAVLEWNVLFSEDDWREYSRWPRWEGLPVWRWQLGRGPSCHGEEWTLQDFHLTQQHNTENVKKWRQRILYFLKLISWGFNTVILFRFVLSDWLEIRVTCCCSKTSNAKFLQHLHVLFLGTFVWLKSALHDNRSCLGLIFFHPSQFSPSAACAGYSCRLWTGTRGQESSAVWRGNRGLSLPVCWSQWFCRSLCRHFSAFFSLLGRM